MFSSPKECRHVFSHKDRYLPKFRVITAEYTKGETIYSIRTRFTEHPRYISTLGPILQNTHKIWLTRAYTIFRVRYSLSLHSVVFGNQSFPLEEGMLTEPLQGTIVFTYRYKTRNSCTVCCLLLAWLILMSSYRNLLTSFVYLSLLKSPLILSFSYLYLYFVIILFFVYMHLHHYNAVRSRKVQCSEWKM